MQIDSNRFPLLVSYLDGLPDGLDSHPKCVAKGSMLRTDLSGGIPFDPPVGEVPEPIVALLAEPPLNSQWIPEVHSVAAHLVAYDLRFPGDWDRAIRHIYRTNRRIVESPIYRVVTMVAGPRLLLKGAQRRWEQLHRGVTLKAHLEDSDTAGRLELTFPDGLFSYEFVGGMGYAFKALLEANRTLPVHQQMTEFSPTRAVFVADWSPGAAERWSSVPPISGRPGSLPGARPISVPPPPKVPSGLSQDRDGGGSSEP